MNKNIIIGAVFFIAIASFITKFSGDGVSLFQNVGNKNTASLPVATGNNAVTVGNQSAGNSVTIESVSLEKKGFAVIHEKDGELLGKIIGSSALLEAGESSNVAITLREPLQKGKKYLAVLVVDNGDGRYMPGADHPVVDANDANGGALKAEFSVGAVSD